MRNSSSSNTVQQNFGSMDDSLKNETTLDVQHLLNYLKQKCLKMQSQYPKYFYVDNSNQWEHVIKEIFPEAIVLQDIGKSHDGMCFKKSRTLLRF